MIYYFTIYGKLLRTETEVKKRRFLVSLILSWLYIDQNGKMTNSKVEASKTEASIHRWKLYFKNQFLFVDESFLAVIVCIVIQEEVIRQKSNGVFQLPIISNRLLTTPFFFNYFNFILIHTIEVFHMTFCQVSLAITCTNRRWIFWAHLANTLVCEVRYGNTMSIILTTSPGTRICKRKYWKKIKTHLCKMSGWKGQWLYLQLILAQD